MAQTEAQIRAKNEYRKKVKRITIEFSIQDQDLYEYINNQESKSGFVKELIRKSMREESYS